MFDGEESNLKIADVEQVNFMFFKFISDNLK